MQVSSHMQYCIENEKNAGQYDSAADGPEIGVIRALTFGTEHCPECLLCVPKYAQREHSLYWCYAIQR